MVASLLAGSGRDHLRNDSELGFMAGQSAKVLECRYKIAGHGEGECMMTMKRILAGVLAILLGGALAGYSVADEEAEEGTRPDSVDGSGIDSVDGSGIDSVDGSGIDSVDGSGMDSVDGSDIDSADGSEEAAEEEEPEEGKSKKGGGKK